VWPQCGHKPHAGKTRTDATGLGPSPLTRPKDDPDRHVNDRPETPNRGRVDWVDPTDPGRSPVHRLAATLPQPTGAKPASGSRLISRHCIGSADCSAVFLVLCDEHQRADQKRPVSAYARPAARPQPSRPAPTPALIDQILRDAGITAVPTGVRIPRMNAIMERWVKTLRAELLDRTPIWNETHLRHTLHQYQRHYNTPRVMARSLAAGPTVRGSHDVYQPFRGRTTHYSGYLS
jgi:hypothetical protein